jgi:hypothetical protein
MRAVALAAEQHHRAQAERRERREDVNPDHGRGIEQRLKRHMRKAPLVEGWRRSGYLLEAMAAFDRNLRIGPRAFKRAFAKGRTAT